MQGQERDKNQLSWVPVSHWKKLLGKGQGRKDGLEWGGAAGEPSKVGERAQTKQIKKMNRRGNGHSLMLCYELLDTGPGTWRGSVNDWMTTCVEGSGCDTVLEVYKTIEKRDRRRKNRMRAEGGENSKLKNDKKCSFLWLRISWVENKWTLALGFDFACAVPWQNWMSSWGCETQVMKFLVQKCFL